MTMATLKETFNWIACLQFRNLVHYYHGGKQGIFQAYMMLEKLSSMFSCIHVIALANISFYPWKHLYVHLYLLLLLLFYVYGCMCVACMQLGVQKRAFGPLEQE